MEIAQNTQNRLLSKDRGSNISPEAALTRASRRKPEWVVREVLRLKVLMGKRSYRKIADSFNDQHGTRTGWTVGKTFVSDGLKANQYALSCLHQEMRNRRPRPVPINAVWATDLTFYTNAGGHPPPAHARVRAVVQRQGRALVWNLETAAAPTGHSHPGRTANGAGRVHPVLQPCPTPPEPGWAHARASVERAEQGRSDADATQENRAGAGAGWSAGWLLHAAVAPSTRQDRSHR